MLQTALNSFKKILSNSKSKTFSYWHISTCCSRKKQCTWVVWASSLKERKSLCTLPLIEFRWQFFCRILSECDWSHCGEVRVPHCSHLTDGWGEMWLVSSQEGGRWMLYKERKSFYREYVRPFLLKYLFYCVHKISVLGVKVMNTKVDNINVKSSRQSQRWGCNGIDFLQEQKICI